ncbi:MAG: CehA/McbA family metallohydrolase, partial [Pseudomonadota bacterium]
QDHITVIYGSELSGMARTASAPFTNGHLNVFPVQARPNEFSGGLPRHEGLRLRELYSRFGDSGSRPLFQLNHPRTVEPDSDDFDGNFFEHLYFGQGFDPKQKLTSPVNKILLEKQANTNLRDLDFDLLEVANGPAYGHYKRTQSDWFSLLSQGERIVGSANSDTHGTRHLVSIPQNFVALDEYTEEAFLSAVKEGRMSGSTGPILKVFIENESGEPKRPGDTYAGNSFVLSVDVQAASWVPVAELALFINGKTTHRQAVSAGDTISLPLELTKDSYIVVEVNGATSKLYNELAPDFRPFAFSNPIYIDADQDEQWTAPGL